MTYWLFQGNPKYYRIIDGIRDSLANAKACHTLSKGYGCWRWGLIRKAGDQAGIYAISYAGRLRHRRDY